MAYDYYRGYQPQYWGTQQYQLPAAPRVSYVPQTGWGGMDYYRAHTRWADVQEDDDIFDRIIHGVRRWIGNAGSNAEEARDAHQRVYAGWVDMRVTSPEIIGAAAAYEALRFWETNQSLRMPVMDDLEREEDAIMGLAVAEASKLWGYTGRLLNDRGRSAAAEEAAATVHRIFRRQNRGLLRYDTYNSLTGEHIHRYDDAYDGGYYDSGGLRRRRSFANLTGDLAAYDGYDRARRASFAGGYGAAPLPVYAGGAAPLSAGLVPGTVAPLSVAPLAVSPYGAGAAPYGQPLISPVVGPGYAPVGSVAAYPPPPGSAYLTPGYTGHRYV
ncbi:hypothetical protein DACRYDRAFT_20507 [Dacryopinax primogenitus]|uniref:Uncharacterized protein n=1 Tax=Dacryopinax primogenitus (strain DJM 731) TaxID=1858805 RepID=M5G3U7_DACPD|nr:uncharacterized protein DACRYDRAFT_20507 [Dacryopinax primogenitus]EJU04921.1 hypothetical protein DACRYDRAFT_20507 [Dacryopinax primogenitus]